MRGGEVRDSGGILVLGALLLAFGWLGCTPPEPTPDFESLSYPVPIDMEGRTIRSSLYLHAQVKTYDLPVEEFEERKLEPREAVFAQLMRALRESDYGTVARLVYGSEPWEGDVAKPAVEIWRQSLGNFENMNVLAQVAIGSKGLFVLAWPGTPELPPGALNRIAFTIQDLPDLQFRARFVDEKDPLEFFILYLFRKIRREPEAYRPLRDLKLPFEYVLLDDEAGPVSWQFRGELLDVGLLEKDSGGSQNEVVRFYQNTFRDFAAPNWEQFLNALTPIRRRAAEIWFGRVSPEQFEQARENATQGRQLRLLLDADPIFFLFTEHAQARPSRPQVTWEYVVRETDSPGLRLASRDADKPFERLFSDPAYLPDDAKAFVARVQQAQQARVPETRSHAAAGDAAPSRTH